MNNPIQLPVKPPSTDYHAELDDKIIYSGTMANVVPFIARKRVEGLDVKSHADGLTREVQQQRSLKLENNVELHCVGYRLQDDPPTGFFMPGLFLRPADAATHRAKELHDPEGTKYASKGVNWRGARL